MDIHPAIAYTIVAQWIAGAIVAILACAAIIIGLMHVVVTYWAPKLTDLRMAIYLRRGMRELERNGYQRPDKKSSTATPPDKAIRILANAVIDLAREEGYVVTIETQPFPPLAMGRHFMVAEVRKARDTGA